MYVIRCLFARFCRQNEAIPCYIDDLIANVGSQYRRKANKEGSGGDKEEEPPEAVFNVLDDMLKGSLDRLKAMR